jgi:hypothetical protein
MCTHPIDATCVHLLCCAHSNEHMGTHDAVRNSFVAITLDAEFHVGQKQLHAFLSTTFHPSCQWVDIVLTKDGICTPTNVVIIDPTWVNCLRWSCVTQRFATSKVAQAKERSYYDRHPMNHFLTLAIEVFGCLDKQVDVFLHNCADAMWNLKRLEGSPLFVLVTFLYQKISIILQRMQTSSILSWAVTVRVVISQLPPFKMHPLSPWLTSFNRSIVERERFWYLVCVSFTSCKLILFIYLFPLYFF